MRKRIERFYNRIADVGDFLPMIFLFLLSLPLAPILGILWIVGALIEDD